MAGIEDRHTGKQTPSVIRGLPRKDYPSPFDD